MTDRIVDIADTPAYLSVENGLLRIEPEGGVLATLPVADLAVLVLSHPRIRMSHAVLSGLASNGGALVACDERRHPVGMYLPLQAHSIQTERMEAQAAAALPTKKRLWKQIVQAKIRAQATVLVRFRGEDSGLAALAKRVRSGDVGNHEAQASRKYWPRVFGNPEFRRHREAPDQNRHLNYGYAVLRAVVGRAVCAAGLHPSLGLHHHNRYNAFCLADDLMEPFRPLVDQAVAGLIEKNDPFGPLDSHCRRELVAAICGKYIVEHERRSLFDICSRLAQSLAAVYVGEKRNLNLPDVNLGAR